MLRLPKIMVYLTVGLFTLISGAAWWKHHSSEGLIIENSLQEDSPLEIELDRQISSIQETAYVIEQHVAEPIQESPVVEHTEIERIEEFFDTNSSRLPIVQSISYSPKVHWQPNRSAWIVDYAKHYKTSTHFIARCLNGHPSYKDKQARTGDRFNVLRIDKPFEFYLNVDIAKCTMKFYFFDLDTKQKTFLKTYRVCLGRPDPNKKSGFLTPTGTYILGSRLGIYDLKKKGYYKGKLIEMIRVFGTRWIPFDKEIANCSEPAKGFGIHGVPWKEDGDSKRLIEDISSIGYYESDGCIRMQQKDVEELFSIISTRKTIIDIN